MGSKANRYVIVAVVCIGGFLSGCGTGGEVELRYKRPSQYQIPSMIKRIGIAEFGGQSAQDMKWGQIASDRLASALDVYNRRYHRYQLVERQRLKAVLDEQDLQMAISDTDTASQLGKLVNVQAMIYGNAKVTTSDERATRTVFDPIKQKTKTIHYIKRYCLAAVNFTMDDIITGRTLATVSVMREFDSEKQNSSTASMLGMAMGLTTDKLPPTDQIVSGLIDQCVQEFLRKISPHEIVLTVKLQRGNSKLTNTANKLAVAGDYADALACYERALQIKPQDHDTMFNAGLMHEALGRYQQAEQFYDRAFKTAPKEKYILARKRVRTENSERTPSP